MSVVAPSQWVMTYVPSIGCACLTFWLFQFLLWFLLAQWIHIGIIFSWRLEGEFYRSTQHAHATHPLVNHVLFLQGTLRCLILTFRQDKPRGRCFGTGKHSKKNKTLWTDFFFFPDWILRSQRVAAFPSMMRVIQIILIQFILLIQLEMAWWGSNCWV